MGLINPVTQSKIDYLMNLRKEHYAHVQDLRDYASGDFPDYLTDDQKIQLVGESGASGTPNSDPEFGLNVCETVLGVETDRLTIQDIAVTVEGREDLSDQLSKLIWSWFKRNRMDEGQQHAHYASCRDGDSYAVCWWDDSDGDDPYPRIAINQVYDGEHAGADVYYTDGDPMQPECAVKIWIADESAQKKIRRKNVYYDDRVEKWISEGQLSGTFADATWRPLKFGDDDWDLSLEEVESLSQPGKTATVAWWTETGTAPLYNENGDFISGSPGMGIPVKHFRHNAKGTSYGTSSIESLVPGLQDAINRAGLDVQAAAVLAGFPLNYIIGAERDNTTYTTQPGRIFVVEAPGGSAGQWGPAPLEPLIKVKDTFIKDAATLTATPLTYFNLSGVIPAEGTQQSLEMALLAKVKRDQVSFGNTWEDVIRMMLKMEKTWGTALRDIPIELLDDIEINCVWDDAKITNEREQYEIAEKMRALGVPDRFIFRHLGFTEDEIDQMMTEKDAKRNAVIGTLGARVQQMDTQNAQAQALALEQARKDGRQESGVGEVEPIAA